MPDPNEAAAAAAARPAERPAAPTAPVHAPEAVLVDLAERGPLPLAVQAAQRALSVEPNAWRTLVPGAESPSIPAYAVAFPVGAAAASGLAALRFRFQPDPAGPLLTWVRMTVFDDADGTHDLAMMPVLDRITYPTDHPVRAAAHWWALGHRLLTDAPLWVMLESDATLRFALGPDNAFPNAQYGTPLAKRTPTDQPGGWTPLAGSNVHAETADFGSDLADTLVATNAMTEALRRFSGIAIGADVEPLWDAFDLQQTEVEAYEPFPFAQGKVLYAGPNSTLTVFQQLLVPQGNATRYYDGVKVPIIPADATRDVTEVRVRLLHGDPVDGEVLLDRRWSVRARVGDVLFKTIRFGRVDRFGRTTQDAPTFLTIAYDAPVGGWGRKVPAGTGAIYYRNEDTDARPTVAIDHARPELACGPTPATNRALWFSLVRYGTDTPTVRQLRDPGTVQPVGRTDGVSLGRFRSVVRYGLAGNAFDPASPVPMLRNLTIASSGDSGSGTLWSRAESEAHRAWWAGRGVALTIVPGKLPLKLDSGGQNFVGPIYDVDDHLAPPIGFGERDPDDACGTEGKQRPMPVGSFYAVDADFARARLLFEGNVPGGGVVQVTVDGVPAGQVDTSPAGAFVTIDGFHFAQWEWTAPGDAVARRVVRFSRPPDGRLTPPRWLDGLLDNGPAPNQLYVLPLAQGNAVPNEWLAIDARRWAAYQAVGFPPPHVVHIHSGASVWQDAYQNGTTVDEPLVRDQIAALLEAHIAAGRRLWGLAEGDPDNPGAGVIYRFPHARSDFYAPIERARAVMEAARAQVVSVPVDGFNEGAYIITHPDPFGYLAADQFHLSELGAQVLAEAVVRELYYRGF